MANYWIWFWSLLTLAVIGTAAAITPQSEAAEFVVYGVYKPLDLGSPDDQPKKDYYINMGSAQGVHPGTVLTVMKRTATYDLLSEKLFKEIVFPIAQLKVVHVENNAAVARLDKMMPQDKTPAVTPYAVMVGDIVRVSE